MARQNPISMATGSTTLKEIYGLVIDNVQKKALSTALKSQQYTGNPAAGSAEFTRFVNATSKAYGTARTAGAGDKISAPPVAVVLNQHKEIVEEIAKFDMDTFTVPGILRRRADNHVNVMAAELDRAFFSEAATGGTAVTPTATAIQDVVEEIVQQLECVHNNYVDGVDRDMMDFVLSPAKFGRIRTFLDTQPNVNVDTAAEEFGMYHGVRIYSSTRLPNGTNGILMARQSVAQPVRTDEYSEPEKIPLSNDYGISLFYDYGTKALAPDLILVW